MTGGRNQKLREKDNRYSFQRALEGRNKKSIILLKVKSNRYFSTEQTLSAKMLLLMENLRVLANSSDAALKWMTNTATQHLL